MGYLPKLRQEAKQDRRWNPAPHFCWRCSFQTFDQGEYEAHVEKEHGKEIGEAYERGASEVQPVKLGNYKTYG